MNDFIPDHLLDSSTSTNPRNKRRKKPAPKKKPKRKKWDSEEEEEEEEFSETEEEEMDFGDDDETPPQVMKKEVDPDKPRRKVGRPRKEVIPQDQISSPKLDGEKWFFKCICGLEGENIDGKIVSIRMLINFLRWNSKYMLRIMSSLVSYYLYCQS